MSKAQVLLSLELKVKLCYAVFIHTRITTLLSQGLALLVLTLPWLPGWRLLNISMFKCLNLCYSGNITGRDRHRHTHTQGQTQPFIV